MQTKITLGEIKHGGKPITICDPACGSGRYLLATARHFSQSGAGFNFLMVNIDVDVRAYVFTILSAVMKQIPAVVIWGNAISMEAYEGCAVLPEPSLSAATWHLLSKEKATSMITQYMKQEKETFKKDKTGQLLMFS